jgi:WD40 repeat protein
VAWQPSGRHLAVTQLGLLLLLDAQGNGDRRVIVNAGVESVGAPAWSPDGRWLAASNFSRVLLHHADGKPHRRWEAHRGQMAALAWSPDSRWLVSCSDDRTVRFWTTDGSPGPVLAGAHLGVFRLAWAPSGKLATLTGDGVLALWELAGRQVRPLWSGLLVEDGAVAFSAGGALLQGSKAMLDQHFVCVVQTEAGALELRRPSEFRRGTSSFK